MKEIIRSDRAPDPVGPYSQAVRANGFLFLAGQIPLDPETGKLVEGDVSVQTRRVLENLKAVLEAAGSSLDNVVRTGIFVADLADFAAINKVYAEYFVKDPPARATVQAAALPLGARVEIDCMAVS